MGVLLAPLPLGFRLLEVVLARPLLSGEISNSCGGRDEGKG